MTTSTTRLALAAVALLAADLSAHADDTLLPAPHQVEFVAHEVGEHDAPTELRAPWVSVDFGRAGDEPIPVFDENVPWTLLGTEGVLPARLMETVRVCSALCGDEMVDCHFEARLAPVGGLESIGVPVAALPGTIEVDLFAAFGPWKPAPGEPLVPGYGSFSTPVWPEDNPDRSRARLVLRDGSWVYEYAWGNAGPYELRAGACEAGPRGPLTRVRCELVEALFDGDRMLLSGAADYAGPAADLHASFEHGGRTFYLLRLSLKAQVVWGLLYRDDAGAWHALIRPREHALLC